MSALNIDQAVVIQMKDYKESKEKFIQKECQRGRDYGIFWAKEIANYRQLSAVSKFSILNKLNAYTVADAAMSEETPNSYEYYFEPIILEPAMTMHSIDVFDFWHNFHSDVADEGEPIRTEYYLRGFVEAVCEIFETIKQ